LSSVAPRIVLSNLPTASAAGMSRGTLYVNQDFHNGLGFLCVTLHD
jgi:hypothetical protein